MVPHPLQVVELLKAKRVTPERLIEVVRNRIDRVNTEVNAVVTTCFDRALEKLGQLRLTMAQMESFPPGFLYGMPVLIKDTNYVKGVRFSLDLESPTTHSPERRDGAKLLPRCGGHRARRGGAVY